MSTVTVAAEEMPFVLKFGSLLKPMSDDEFYEFCQQHEDLKVEMTSGGDLVIMPPTGGETGNQNFSLTGRFFNWVELTAQASGSTPLPSSSCPTARSVRRMWPGWSGRAGTH